jgi:hypothetical protein
MRFVPGQDVWVVHQIHLGADRMPTHRARRCRVLANVLGMWRIAYYRNERVFRESDLFASREAARARADELNRQMSEAK